MFKNLLLEFDYESLDQFNIDLGLKIAKCIVESETTDITYIIEESTEGLINTSSFSLNQENNVHIIDESSLIFFISEYLISNLSLEQFTDNNYFRKQFSKIQHLNHFIEGIDGLPEHIMYLLHKKYNIDISLCITSLSNNQRNWSEYKTFFDILPYIYKDHEQLYSLIYFFYEKIMQGKSPQTLDRAFEVIATNNHIFAEEFFDNLKYTDDEAIHYFAPSILCGLLSKNNIEGINEILNDLENTNNPKLHEVIIGTIGILIYNNNTNSYINYFSQFLNRLDRHEWNHFNPKLMWAYGLLYKYNNSVLDKMINMIDNDSLDVIDEYSSFLFVAENYGLSMDIFDKLLYDLSNYQLNNVAIHNCDSLLYRRFDHNPKLIWEFLENWIISHEVNSDDERSITNHFSTLFSKLNSNQNSLTEKLTRWLTYDSFRYQIEIRNWLNSLYAHDITTLELDTKVLNQYTPIDFIFVARKISVLALNYKLLCSLLFSMTKYNKLNTQLQNELETIFTQYVTFNYPEFTIKFLNEKLINATETESILITRIKNNWELYNNHLNKLSYLKEAKIPKDVVAYYNKKQQEQMTEMSNKPSKNSFSALFSNRVTIKYGVSWAHEIEGTYSEPQGMMQQSYSTPLPRNFLIDPISDQIYRINNLNLRKEDINYDASY